MRTVNAFIAPMTGDSQVPSPDPPPGEYWTRYQERLARGSGHFDQRLNKANTARTIHDDPKS